MAKREARYELQVKRYGEWWVSNHHKDGEALDVMKKRADELIANAVKLNGWNFEYRIVELVPKVIYPKPKKARK